MLARALAATPWGIDARPVEVEVDIQLGLPHMQLVGLPDTAVKESRERVRAAIKNCGFRISPRSTVINLAPADLKKEGSHLDLAIALALLAAHREIPEDALAGRLFCGELGLDGALRPIRGALAIASLARELGARELLVPERNADEAAALESMPVIGLAHLSEAIEHVVGVQTRNVHAPAAAPTGTSKTGVGATIELADVRGQENAKRALEVAAAGAHNLLLVGPPGTGKTMLARCLPGILPPLTRDESVTLTKIQSVADARPPEGLVTRRPFRSPHTSVSTAGLIGGGSNPRPGEVSLAHAGVLFLDELPEFRRDTLEALRQPLEEGAVTVVRARARLRFPARFALIAAMNPCPCGYAGDPRRDCTCPPQARSRYRARISGPLLDRIDLQVEMPRIDYSALPQADGERSRQVAARVDAARQRQRLRRQQGWNAALAPRQLDRHCALARDAESLLVRAADKLALSLRSVHRVIKVARTLTDLQGGLEIGRGHVAEALQYRIGALED